MKTPILVIPLKAALTITLIVWFGVTAWVMGGRGSTENGYLLSPRFPVQNSGNDLSNDPQTSENAGSRRTRDNQSVDGNGGEDQGELPSETFPTRWWVNGNGQTGLLIYSVDPKTNKVTGTLLGVPVEGCLVGRHLVLMPQSRGNQVWDGWMMDRQHAGEVPIDKCDYFIAGTFSRDGGGPYPWYGIQEGSILPGGPGLSLESTGDPADGSGALSRQMEGKKQLDDFYVVIRSNSKTKIIVKGKKEIHEGDKILGGPFTYREARLILEKGR